MIKLLILTAFSFFQPGNAVDSLGVETINGQTFVIHRVEEKETLFGISRRYGTTVDAILQHNAEAGSGLEIGQILRVPYRPAPPRPTGAVVHSVEQGETLYAISRRYNVSPDDIRRWNNLPDNTISVGQELIVRRASSGNFSPPAEAKPVMVSRKGVHTVEAGQTLYSISRQYNISIEDLRAWNSLEGNELKVGQLLYVTRPERSEEPAEPKREEPPVRQTAPPQPEPEPEPAPTPSQSAEATEPQPISTGQSAESIRISESLKTGDEIVESGIAELIEGTEGNRKYLALHRTAPMGTILKVRNEMNNREVFVRVQGKLPDTALTDKVIIRISRSAYDRLGAIDPRFRVEVTYYK